MSSRGILSLALIIVGVACERFAYYGARTFLMVDLRSGDDSLATYAQTYLTMTWVGVACTFVGAAIAFGIGPRGAAAIGMLLSAVGCFMLAAGSYSPGGMMLSAGAGILRPCPAAAAAEVLGNEDGAAAPSPRRFAAVTAFMLLLYGAINFGAPIAPAFGRALRTGGTSTVAYSVDGVIALIGTACAAGAAVLGFMKTKEAVAPPPTDVYRTPAYGPNAHAAPVGNTLVGVAILAAANVFYTAALPLTYPSFRAMFPEWVHTLNPIVVMLVTVVLGVVWIVGTQQRWSTAPLTFYGMGLAVFAFGLLVIGIAGDSLGGHALGQMIAAAGEGAAGTIATAYVALAIRNRAATLLVAGWMAVGTIVGMFAARLDAMESKVGLAIVFAFVLGGGGVALAALGRKLHRDFFDPPVNA